MLKSGHTEIGMVGEEHFIFLGQHRTESHEASGTSEKKVSSISSSYRFLDKCLCHDSSATTKSARPLLSTYSTTGISLT
jgi:hypothetical protein